MHYYTKDDQITQMQTRIRELEEQNAASELLLAAAWDEVDQCWGREKRLLWTALAFGTLMVAAIVQASWLAMGR